jgi:uncharacterized protein (DUF1501 family)
MSAIPSTYLSPATVAAMQAAAAANGGNDSKTLVCLYLPGGIDSHNMLIPALRDAPAANSAEAIQRRAQYEAARPVPAVGHANSTLFPMTDLDPAGASLTDGFGVTYKWGMHPALTYIGESYNYATNIGPQAIKCAVLRHVGTLDRPLTKAEYEANPRWRPDQLFAHNVQQDLWQAADIPDAIRSTGWFGRAMNLLDPYYNAGQATALGAYTTSSSALQGRAHNDLSAVTVPGIAMTTGDGRGNAAWTAAFRSALRGVATPYATSKNLIHRSFVSLMTAAEQEQTAVNAALAALPATQDAAFTALPTISGRPNIFREGLRTAARVIFSKDQARLNQRRQVIFVSVGGWDHHSALRANQDSMLQHLDNALYVFWNTLQELGLDQSVTLFTQSEFGRTFQSNGTGGTDHAWAGHSFVMGSAVRSGMYGPEPDYTINGNRDTGQGRFIPEISTEQYFATLLKWFGIPEAQLPLVLPNLGAFSSADLGFMGTTILAPPPAPAPAPPPAPAPAPPAGGLSIDAGLLSINAGSLSI